MSLKIIANLAAVFVLGSWSDQVVGKCVFSGACYALSAEVVSCEVKDTMLVVGTKARTPKVIPCSSPVEREVPGWEIE